MRREPDHRHTAHMMIPLILRAMLTALGFEQSIADLLVEVLSFLFRIIG